jgi:hypothetical protein
MQTSVVVERVFQVESFRFVVSLQQGSKARQGKLGLALIRMCIWWTCQGFAD